MKVHPLLRGSLETIILSLLEDREMYGYELTQHAKKITEGEITITEGALYPALHKLEAKGLLTTRIVTVDNRKRKYYALTEDGNATAVQKRQEFAKFAESMSLLLKPNLSIS